MVQQVAYSESELDGDDPGGFVVMNLDALMNNPYQILEEENGGYFATLDEARAACRRFREEFENDRIFVYALVGVREAVDRHPEVFPLS